MRFAAYLRLSTTDKQDPALSFPSQQKACEQAVAEQGGEITIDFQDQQSGARDDRPGLTSLLAEARDPTSRRFDHVIAYSTSRVSRVQLHALLYEQELRKAGVQITFATGGPIDPNSADGMLQLSIRRAFDEFERDKLAARPSAGCARAPSRVTAPEDAPPTATAASCMRCPTRHRGDRSKSRVTLEPDPDEAQAVAEIFHLHADKAWSPKAIADHLNRPGGPPPPPTSIPAATSAATGRPARSARCCATPSTPAGWSGAAWTSPPPVKRGRPAPSRPGGVGRRRATLTCRSSPTRCSRPLAGALRATPVAGQPRGTERAYLFAGMVHCATGHQPLSMQGKARKGHHYYACSYGASYGEPRHARPTPGRSGSTCARTPYCPWSSASSSSASSDRCAWTSWPSSFSPTGASSAARPACSGHGCANRSPRPTARSRSRSRPLRTASNPNW